ncbi:GPI transamidase subunit PIG-U [Gautieria morchelliformis]|nr:GPI transamidase subunit PIG-U [Gautieria morchelliformis]
METKVLAGALAIRLLAACSPLQDVLQDDQQLASPLTSYARLREGVYLFKHGIDPYSGGVFRQSPILLSLFSTILPLSPALLSPLLWTLCDGIGAWSLSRIWRLRCKSSVTYGSREGLIVISYLLNPYLFLPSLALSTSTFDNTLFLLALHSACLGNLEISLLLLALLTHLSPTSVLLLPPILFLNLAGPSSRLSKPIQFVGYRRAVPLALHYVTYLSSLALISTLVSGGWGWIGRTWGAVLTLPELTPNPGLWWYFFTEMFDYFRPFFLMAFSMHLIIYVAPISIKFQHDPLFATFLLQGIFAIFKSYPTLSDPGLFLSMLSIFPEIYPYLKTPIVTTLLHLHASLLLPLFHRLWLSQGTGNANFFYASTLVFGLANGFAVLDAMWAGLRIAFGAAKEGWEIVQT